MKLLMKPSFRMRSAWFQPQLLLACLLLLASCMGERSSSSLAPWYGQNGTRLTCSASGGADSPAVLDRAGRKSRFVLKEPFSLQENLALRVEMECAAGSLRIGMKLADERNKVSDMIFTVPAGGIYAFVLKPAQLASVKWAEFTILEAPEKAASPSAETSAPLIRIRELRMVPETRGFAVEGGLLELSPHVSFEKAKEASTVRIRTPFPSGRSMDKAQPHVLEIKVEGTSQILKLIWGSRELRIRARTGVSDFLIPASFMDIDPAEIALQIPAGMELLQFRTRTLSEANGIPKVDPGIFVFHAPLGEAPYAVARWDVNPDVLIFLFRDYAVQDRYLKRLAFFVEKIGFAGTLAADAQIAGLHGWNAHDYKADDLARFFDKASRTGFSLSREEIELRDLLVETGIIARDGRAFRPLRGAIVAISQESPAYLQQRFLTHELSHALFFTDPGYRDLALALWEHLSEEERWFPLRYFRWMAYDVQSKMLMANEMQAYLVQQPLKDLPAYFSKTLASRLGEDHPELKPQIEEYMKTHLPAIVDAARQLAAYLNSALDLEPGRLFRIY